MVTILDIPHHLYMWLKIKMSPFSNLYEVEDDWYFDMGYSYAISLSIFIIGLIYSATVPLIPVFTSLFFAIKVSFCVFCLEFYSMWLTSTTLLMSTNMSLNLTVLLLYL